MKIKGGCHCGNITYVFDRPGDDDKIPVRACSCRFCTMHGGTYTSHPESALSAFLEDSAAVSKYRFGTRTADFFVCSRCGAVPFVTCEIDGRLVAVVNVNTFQDVDEASFKKAVTDFDGESTESRLERRARTWIPAVTISNVHP